MSTRVQSRIERLERQAAVAPGCSSCGGNGRLRVVVLDAADDPSLIRGCEQCGRGYLVVIE